MSEPGKFENACPEALRTFNENVLWPMQKLPEPKQGLLFILEGLFYLVRIPRVTAPHFPTKSVD